MKKATAAALLSKRIPTARTGMTVSAVRRAVLHERCRWDSVTYVYILDAQEHPVGVVSMKELICADAKASIDAVMTRDIVIVHPTTDQEHVAMRAIRHGIKAVPVVDGNGRFLGVVGTDAILKTLHAEHVEDFLRYAGIRHTERITDILKARVGELVRHRLPWLIVGLVGSMVGTLVVRAFEGVLTYDLRLAFFIPLIVYMSDALGTQTQTLYIRSLAMEHPTLRRLLPRELGVTVVMSAVCAVLIATFALVGFRSPAIAWTVGLALFLTMLSASALALTVTTILARAKRDPALGGGPLATVIQDVVSLLLYFLIASAIILR